VRMRRIEKKPKCPPFYVLKEKVIGHGPSEPYHIARCKPHDPTLSVSTGGDRVWGKTLPP
jgi:hypothetical protein